MASISGRRYTRRRPLNGGRILQWARKHGGFVGVDEGRFPRDFAAFVRYHADLKKVPARYPMPGSLPLTRLEEFLGRTGDRYPVRWT